MRSLAIAALSAAALVSWPQLAQAQAQTESFSLTELTVAHDGKKRFLAYRPPRFSNGKLTRGSLYFGDGRVFNEAISRGLLNSVSPDKTLVEYELLFDDPRYSNAAKLSLKVSPGKVTLQCGKVKHAFHPVDRKAVARMAKTVKLRRKRWNRHPDGLYRDDDGRYYYVDRHLDQSRPYDRHLYVGERGKMKRVKLRNVIVDVAGELYTSKAGRLKVVYKGRRKLPEATWTTRKGKVATLTTVDHRSRHTIETLIYADLGIYLGKKFHSPCDWL